MEQVNAKFIAVGKAIQKKAIALDKLKDSGSSYYDAAVKQPFMYQEIWMDNLFS
jgi:hypothetical protein